MKQEDKVILRNDPRKESRKKGNVPTRSNSNSESINNTGQTDFKKTSQILKALAHPTRLLITETLLEGEKCVLEIQDLLQSSQPNISQHLNILKYSEIVDFRQEGNLRCYFLKNPEKIKALIQALRLM